MDAVGRRGSRREPGAVPGDPAGDVLGVTKPDHRLGRHRAVVGEEPVVLGTGVAQAVQGVQQCVHDRHDKTSRQLEVNRGTPPSGHAAVSAADLVTEVLDIENEGDQIAVL